MASRTASTCELFRTSSKRTPWARDLVEELRVELESRVARAYGDIARRGPAPWGVHVAAYNRDGAADIATRGEG